MAEVVNALSKLSMDILKTQRLRINIFNLVNRGNRKKAV